MRTELDDYMNEAFDRAVEEVVLERLARSEDFRKFLVQHFETLGETEASAKKLVSEIVSTLAPEVIPDGPSDDPDSKMMKLNEALQ